MMTNGLHDPTTVGTTMAPKIVVEEEEKKFLMDNFKVILMDDDDDFVVINGEEISGTSYCGCSIVMIVLERPELSRNNRDLRSFCDDGSYTTNGKINVKINVILQLPKILINFYKLIHKSLNVSPTTRHAKLSLALREFSTSLTHSRWI